MAIVVDVVKGDVNRALARLGKKMKEEKLHDAFERQRCHLNGSQRRFLEQKVTFNRVKGHLIQSRLQWVVRRTGMKL